MRDVSRRVLKFGGTSVGSAAALRSLVAIVRASVAEAATVVVVSALSGVTDALEAAVADVAGGRTRVTAIVADLLDRHLALLASTSDGLHRAEGEAALHARADELEALLLALADAARRDGRPSVAPAARDAVLACGEHLSVPTVTAALETLGLDAIAADARRLVRTDAAFGAASVDFAATRVQVRARLGAMPRRTVPVVAGFVGATADGATTTLGRGGSDYSAAILGWALDAARVEIWTDVDGVMTADPRVARDARLLPRLSYREAAAIARGGAKVLHPRTLEPLEDAGIPVVVRNTFRPERAGTWIGPARGTPPARPSADRREVAEVTIAGGERRAPLVEFGVGAGVPPAERVRRLGGFPAVDRQVAPRVVPVAAQLRPDKPRTPRE